jgi:hypothetical protein
VLRTIISQHRPAAIRRAAQRGCGFFRSDAGSLFAAAAEAVTLAGRRRLSSLLFA